MARRRPLSFLSFEITVIITLNMNKNVEPTYAYIVILPNPMGDNYIRNVGGVGVNPGGESEILHWVKIGLQKGLDNRVYDYNTHTPSSMYFFILFYLMVSGPADANFITVWFRHLKFTEPLTSEKKNKLLDYHKKKSSRGILFGPLPPAYGYGEKLFEGY